MEIIFEEAYLCELYEDGKTTDKKHRFQPHVVAKYRKTIDILESVANTAELCRFNAMNYEILKGNKKGLESVRVNDQYRIEFTTKQVVSETTITICNIVELSNHYK